MKLQLPLYISRYLAAETANVDDQSLGNLGEGVFGGITHVKFENLIISFIVILCVIITLERGFDYLHKRASDANQLKLFNKMQRELVLMGMISFGVFILNSAVEIDPHGDWFFSFEIVHIVIVFMGFAFLFQAFFLMEYAHYFQTEQLKALRKTSKELLDKFDECNEPKTSWIDKIKGLFELRVAQEQAEYKILRELFVQINPDLPPEFNFSAYIGVLFHEYIAELGEVSPYSWFVLACIVCINGFKNGVIDPATELNYFENVHLNVVRYGIVVAFMLSIAIGIQAYLSFRYYYKLVRTGISMVDCFRSSELENNKLCTETYKACLLDLMDRDSKVGVTEEKKSSSHTVPFPEATGNALDAKTNRRSSIKQENFLAMKKDREERAFKKLHIQLRSKHVSLKVKIFNYYRNFVNFIKNMGKSHHVHHNDNTLHNIFIFSSPKLYFFMIEVILLLQCFYVAIYLTQLVPVSSDFKTAGLRAGWIIGLTIPVFVNLLLVRLVLTKGVILLGIYELHHEAFSTLLDQEISEENMQNELKEKFYEALGENIDGKELTWEERKNLIQENFNEFDYHGTGEISKDEFRELLGHLQIYLSQRKLDLLWSVLDFDLSGSLNVDEVFKFIFPLSKDKLKDELAIVRRIRETYKKRMFDIGIPPAEWIGELKKAFESFDVDKSGYIDEKEIKGLICWVDKELGLSKEVKTMYHALEIVDHRRGISWEEVTKLFNTSGIKSQWLNSLNHMKKVILDELEGNINNNTNSNSNANINDCNTSTNTNIYTNTNRSRY